MPVAQFNAQRGWHNQWKFRIDRASRQHQTKHQCLLPWGTIGDGLFCRLVNFRRSEKDCSSRRDRSAGVDGQ